MYQKGNLSSLCWDLTTTHYEDIMATDDVA